MTIRMWNISISNLLPTPGSLLTWLSFQECHVHGLIGCAAFETGLSLSVVWLSVTQVVWEHSIPLTWSGAPLCSSLLSMHKEICFWVCQLSIPTYRFSVSLGQMVKSGIARSCDTYIFNFIRN